VPDGFSEVAAYVPSAPLAAAVAATTRAAPDTGAVAVSCWLAGSLAPGRGTSRRQAALPGVVSAQAGNSTSRSRDAHPPPYWLANDE
jgi:hypothetical protein